MVCSHVFAVFCNGYHDRPAVREGLVAFMGAFAETLAAVATTCFFFLATLQLLDPVSFFSILCWCFLLWNCSLFEMWRAWEMYFSPICCLHLIFLFFSRQNVNLFSVNSQVHFHSNSPSPWLMKFSNGLFSCLFLNFRDARIEIEPKAFSILKGKCLGRGSVKVTWNESGPGWCKFCLVFHVHCQ